MAVSVTRSHLFSREVSDRRASIGGLPTQIHSPIYPHSIPMQETTATIATLTDLRQYIHAQLCAKENLLEDQFVTRDEILQLRGRPCGRQFQLHGPRSIRLGAVWSSDQNLVYFYDTQGERYLKVRLSTSIADAA